MTVADLAEQLDTLDTTLRTVERELDHLRGVRAELERQASAPDV